jgi:hypothetical protein
MGVSGPILVRAEPSESHGRCGFPMASAEQDRQPWPDFEARQVGIIGLETIMMVIRAQVVTTSFFAPQFD